jgi:hypothetical protein
MPKTIKKHITFPLSMFRLAEIRSKQFGISIAEYVRHLIINDTTSLLKRQSQNDLADFEQLATKSFSFWDNDEDDVYQQFYTKNHEK